MKTCIKKLLTISILIGLISSCQKEDAVDGIPSYIKIDAIDLIDTTEYNNGYTTQLLTDAWVRINGIDKGIYELPANFPVLDKGNVEIRIYGGIKDNGIAAQRVNYPFYNSYIENIFLKEDSITTITPILSVKENIEGQFDDFDESYSFNYDSCCFQKLNNGEYGNYGSMFVSDSIFSTEIKYQDSPLSFDNVPQQGSPAYLELDYKNNTRCLIGLYINSGNGAQSSSTTNWETTPINHVLSKGKWYFEAKIDGATSLCFLGLCDYVEYSRNNYDTSRYLGDNQSSRAYAYYTSSSGQGRVWTGTDALDLGLIDVLGGLEDAIDIAANMASLENYRISSLPKQIDPVEELIKDLTGGAKASILENELGEAYQLYNEVNNILELDEVQMRMPYSFEIK